MENVMTEMQGDTLVLKINASAAARQAARPSSTGKTKVVATSGGNQPIPLPDGQMLYLGLNAYIK